MLHRRPTRCSCRPVPRGQPGTEVIVLLGRLRIREKLALLVLLPLLAVLAATAPLSAGRIQAAHRAAQTADVVRTAVAVGTLIQQLQQERVLSLGYLATDSGPAQLVLGSAQGTDTLGAIPTAA